MVQMIRVADYIAQFLANQGIKHVFLISGGGNVYLIDGVAKNKDLAYVCTHHEQAAAMATEAYARASQSLGCSIVTSGPGGTNAVTGIAGAWLDSIPSLYISGQVNSFHTVRNTGIRQFGVQELNVEDIVRPVTKYAHVVVDPLSIRYHLEKALFIAQSGRPGPVWLEIPIDVQQAMIHPEQLKGFNPGECTLVVDNNHLTDLVAQAIEFFKKSQRPVILAGHGIRLSHSQNIFYEVIEKLGFPVLTTWNGVDLLYEDHPLYVGRPGVHGQRGANFSIQNSDLILALGTRLDMKLVTANPKNFARAAKKIVVDIDSCEIRKGLVKADLEVPFDVKLFLQEFMKQGNAFSKNENSEPWLEKCQTWKKKYPITLPEHSKPDRPLNYYVFIKKLSEALLQDDIIVTDMGTGFTETMRGFILKKGQRLFTNMGLAAMGFGLPAAIGAWFGSLKNGNPNKRVICISGDGGLMMNLQELQTVYHYQIPMKLFLINNNGYLTMSHTQNNYMGGLEVGARKENGVSMPNWSKIGHSFGLPFERMQRNSEIEDIISKALKIEGAVFCEVVMDEHQDLLPKIWFEKTSDGKYIQKPLEDMYPYLPQDEFMENMIIPPMPDRQK